MGRRHHHTPRNPKSPTIPRPTRRPFRNPPPRRMPRRTLHPRLMKCENRRHPKSPQRTKTPHQPAPRLQMKVQDPSLTRNPSQGNLPARPCQTAPQHRNPSLMSPPTQIRCQTPHSPSKLTHHRPLRHHHLNPHASTSFLHCIAQSVGPDAPKISQPFEQWRTPSCHQPHELAPTPAPAPRERAPLGRYPAPKSLLLQRSRQIANLLRAHPKSSPPRFPAVAT
jgi:hypothetical protein